MWTILYNGTEKTVAEWGMVNLQRTLASQAADVVTMIGSTDFDTDPVFDLDETVIIKRDGVQWFYGRVISNLRSGELGNEAIHYTLAGPWWYLDNLVFQQYWNTLSDPLDSASALIPQYKSNLILNLSTAGFKLTTGAQITEITEYAIAQGAPIGMDSSQFPIADIPTDQVRDITCAEAIKKMLRWTPDAVTWFDYAVDGYPVLHIARRGDLAKVELPMTDLVTKATLNPRNDLVSPSVVLKYEVVNDVDGQSYTQVITKAYPEDATGREFGAMLYTVDIQGSQATTTSATLTTRLIDPGSVDYWKAKEPWLQNASIAEIKITKPTRSSGVYAYEVVGGQVCAWMRNGLTPAATVEETVTAEVSFVAKNIHGQVMEVSAGRLLSANIIATNMVSGNYSTVVSATAGEGIPVGLERVIYDAVSVIQWEGSIELTEVEITGRVGMGALVNLSGSRAEWASMNAMAQQITEYVDSGKTVVTFGPPAHIGFNDRIELLRVNRLRSNYTSAAAKTEGIAAQGSKVVLGQATPRENSSPGGVNSLDCLVVGGLITIDGRLTNPDTQLPTQINIDVNTIVGKPIAFREIDVCDGGIDKKMLVLASEPYLPS